MFKNLTQGYIKTHKLEHINTIIIIPLLSKLMMVGVLAFYNFIASGVSNINVLVMSAVALAYVLVTAMVYYHETAKKQIYKQKFSVFLKEELFSGITKDDLDHFMKKKEGTYYEAYRNIGNLEIALELKAKLAIAALTIGGIIVYAMMIIDWRMLLVFVLAVLLVGLINSQENS